MSKAVKLLKKTVFGLVGLLILVIGIILLPLPGPGLLVCLLGLLVLSLEFEWAKSHRDNLKGRFEKIWQDYKDKIKDSK